MDYSKYYIILFIGTFFAGDTFIFPGIYLALKETISMFWFVVIVISSTFISDSCWYLLGRMFSINRLQKFSLIKKREKDFSRILELFETNNIKVLILSKFIYGTRIITQIIFGTAKFPYWKYALINLSIISIWLLFLIFFSYITSEALVMTNINLSNEIAIFITVLIILIIYIWARKVIKKQKLL